MKFIKTIVGVGKSQDQNTVLIIIIVTLKKLTNLKVII